jgi:DNA-binding Xre family transcriptional regulator
MAEARLTASQLADKAGISDSTMNRILHEKGYKTSDSTLTLLAWALNCSPFDLLRDDSIGEMIQKETESAVTGIVAEAVAEAITVVVDELSPTTDTPTPERIADSVPHMQVNAPPVLDVAAYVDHIKQTCEEKITAVMTRFDDMRKSRNFWRVFAIIMIVFIVISIWYFVWEILNPDKGITAALWKIYSAYAPHMFTTATPPPIT